MRISLEAPAKGTNEQVSIYTLDPQQAQVLRNVDIDSKTGLISSRDLAQMMIPGAIPSGLEILKLHFYELTSGAFYMIAFDGVNIYSSLSGTGTWSHLNSGKLITTGKPIPTFINIDNSLWVFNGFDKVAQWKDAGTYRYLDGATTAGTGTMVTTASANVVGTGTLANAELAVGDVITASDTQTRMVISVTDNTHFTLDSAPSPDWAAATFTIQKTPNVPKAELAIYDKNKVVAGRILNSPLSVRMSITTYGGIFIKPDQAKAWPATEELIAPAAFGAALTGMAITKGLVTTQGVSQGRIVLFKDSSIYTLIGTTISDFRFDILSSSVGTRYRHAIVYLEDGSVAFPGELGLYKTDGVEVTRFSAPLQGTYNSLSRIHTTQSSFTFSKNFNGFTLVNTEAVLNILQLSGTNLTGTATSAAFQFSSLTLKGFLNTALQYFADGQTVTIKLRVAATSVGLAAETYHDLVDGELPEDALNVWGQVQISLTRADTTTNPTVTFVQLNYEVSQTLSREPYMVYNADELLFGMDTEYENLRLSLNRNGAWTIDSEDTVVMSSGTRFRGITYLASSAGKVYSLYAEQGEDDTLDCSSEWKTIPVTAKVPHLLKSLDYMVVYSEGDPFKQITVDFIIDGSMRLTRTFTITESALREIRLWMPQGVMFKTLELIFRSTNKQKISKIGRIDLEVRQVEFDPTPLPGGQ